jgi:hypothetical protein
MWHGTSESARGWMTGMRSVKDCSDIHSGGNAMFCSGRVLYENSNSRGRKPFFPWARKLSGGQLLDGVRERSSDLTKQFLARIMSWANPIPIKLSPKPTPLLRKLLNDLSSRLLRFALQELYPPTNGCHRCKNHKRSQQRRLR